jgi:putative PIN family toxin of toxin-antitoxin system
MIVADTNVILRGVRSPQGASGYVLRGMLGGEIAFAASPSVILEYEDVLKRQGALGEFPVASHEDVNVILDALCSRAVETQPWFRLRPFLDDPKDDLFVECALASGARLIVTDDRHFRHPAVSAFGLRVVSAKEFVSELRHGRKST